MCSPSGAATTASGNRPAGCWNWARRSRGPRRDRRAHPGRAAHRDLQYKHMKIGVVALVFRCIPTGGAPRATDESHEAQWLPVPVALRSMPPTFAVRVEDALLPTARARTHDGVIQYFYNKRLLPRRPPQKVQHTLRAAPAQALQSRPHPRPSARPFCSHAMSPWTRQCTSDANVTGGYRPTASGPTLAKLPVLTATVSRSSLPRAR